MGENPDFNNWSAGVQCNHCKDVIFDGVTPEYVMASFSDIVKCPLAPIGIGAPNGSYLLTQDAIDPCKWGGAGPTFVITWSISPDAFLFVLDVAGPARSWFLGLGGAGCDDSFGNSLIDCDPGEWGFGGTGIITWGPSIHP